MVKLSWEDIKAIVHGVVRTEVIDGKLRLLRFTQEEETLYQMRSEISYVRTFATAGVKLVFKTNSKRLGMTVDVFAASSRMYYVHSIIVNNRRIGELSGEIMDGSEATSSGYFDLGEGSKLVEIFFPWSVASQIRELWLDDGAWFTPVRQKRKALIYGDSITQGYDAQKPENAYISILAKQMRMDILNKAVAGETFCPDLAACRNEGVPDVIWIAYGTNDWYNNTESQIIKDSRDFLMKIRDRYPQTEIILLAPIWRADCNEKRPGGDIRRLSVYFRQLAQEIENVKMIDCFDFVPHDPKYYSDLYLHPNDEGFAVYADGIWKGFVRCFPC